MTPQTLHRTTIDTPAGPLLLLVDDAGVVRASGFTDDVGEVAALLPADERPATLRSVDADDADAPTAPAVAAVRAYLDGELGALDDVAVAQRERPATAILRRHLREVPPGAPASYLGLARAAGLDRGSRAAGQACARNAVAPFVPCHRVLRSDGALGGYRWGLAVKRWLLAHEAEHAGARVPAAR